MFLMEHFQEGGWGMYPILLLFAMVLYFTIDRFLYISKSKIDTEKLMSLLKSQIVSGNIQGAINTCQSSPSPATRIIAAGLRRAGGSDRRARDEPVTRLSSREREVLALMAEGRSNVAIAQRLFVTEKAVSKHTTSIFTKLGLAASEDDNRRVLAVLAYLNT